MTLGLLAGCASTQPSPSATIDPKPTGNAEMDRMLSMLQQVDAMEDDAIDLEAMAARSSAASNTATDAGSSSSPDPTNPAAGEAAPVVAADHASDLNADASRTGLASADAPGDPQGEAAQALDDGPPPSLYAQPFALPDQDTHEPDDFEARLAQSNAPPGLPGIDRVSSADATDAADAADPPSEAIPPAQRLADAIRDQSDRTDAFTAALTQAAVAPLVGLAPDADPSLSSEAIGITDAVYVLLTDLSALGSDPDPDVAAAIARAFSSGLDETLSLEITAAALCTRVDGFGRYSAYEAPKFLSGRPLPVIVYVEIDHFAHAPLASTYRGPGQTGASQWEVRLSQEINLYRANETVPVWTLPASTLTDISRNKRRDFHVTNQITLPPALAIGMYKLKITMRDLLSGAEAEKTIALQIVSDPGLLTSN